PLPCWGVTPLGCTPARAGARTLSKRARLSEVVAPPRAREHGAQGGYQCPVCRCTPARAGARPPSVVFPPACVLHHDNGNTTWRCVVCEQVTNLIPGRYSEEPRE